jgi:hypothetical protein
VISSKGKSGKKASGGRSAVDKNYVCKDSRAINFSHTGQHKKSLCIYPKERITINNEKKFEQNKTQIETKTPTKTQPTTKKETKFFNCDVVLLGNDILEQKSSTDVLKLQQFLNKYEGEKLEENGEYNQATIDAVNRYQLKYKDVIMYP